MGLWFGGMLVTVAALGLLGGVVVSAWDELWSWHPLAAVAAGVVLFVAARQVAAWVGHIVWGRPR